MEKETKTRINILDKKDCDISYFVGPGPGGQNKQKNKTGVHIVHRESGAMGRSSETRSLQQNRSAAFINMTQTPKFKLWLARKRYELVEQETMEQAVERQMAPEKLKVECLKDGKWIPYKEE